MSIEEGFTISEEIYQFGRGVDFLLFHGVDLGKQRGNLRLQLIRAEERKGTHAQIEDVFHSD